MLFNLFRKKEISPELYTPRITDIIFDLPDWQLYSQSDLKISWFTAQREAATIQLHAPCQWSFHCHEVDKAIRYWQEQTKQLGGALIELNHLEIAKIPALRAIFKYRSPEANSLAMYYVGIIWIPFQNCLYQINYEDVEKGTTGSREAVVMLMSDNHPSLSDNSEHENIELISSDELFEKSYNHTITALPSDDRKYDSIVPNHPLSRIRFWLDAFPDQVKFSKELRLQPIYKPT